MNDFAAVLAPKSDQINAQDLIAGDMTITIEAVKISPGQEQPVSIRFKGSDKVWRPCKTTGRILMAAWGPDTSIYPGRSVQLYLDPDVKWGGMKVGGIRIRALSHIDGELRLALAESKQNRKIVVVKPLAGRAPEPRRELDQRQASAGESRVVQLAKAAAEKGTDAFRAWFNSDVGKNCRASGELTPAVMGECKVIASGADELLARMAENPLPLDEPFDPNPSTIPDAPPVPTDDEISARIAAELAERDRMLEGG